MEDKKKSMKTKGEKKTNETAERVADLINSLKGKPFFIISPLNGKSPIVMSSHNLAKDLDVVTEMMVEACKYTEGLDSMIVSSAMSLMLNDKVVLAKVFETIASVIQDGVSHPQREDLNEEERESLHKVALRLLNGCLAVIQKSCVPTEVLADMFKHMDAARAREEQAGFGGYNKGGSNELVN